MFRGFWADCRGSLAIAMKTQLNKAECNGGTEDIIGGFKFLSQFFFRVFCFIFSNSSQILIVFRLSKFKKIKLRFILNLPILNKILVHI
jgi:type II secretory pathway component PulF